jgi:hypothetical protein
MLALGETLMSRSPSVNVLLRQTVTGFSERTA